jgi:CDP-paratose 2-epimerase
MRRKKLLVTGSGGLIGSECARLMATEGWTVVGIDNDMRQEFFGPAGTTKPNVEELCRSFPNHYRHIDLDIRDRAAVRDVMDEERPDFIIHTAAQPSHDKAASIPYDDFDVNAGGTMNLLVAARDYCRDSPFCFTSTNKVYGDRPNDLRLLELEKRYDFAEVDSIDESTSIDQCSHSLFGASKVAADVLTQEYGRYYGMKTGTFRGGCLTGANHAGVELHGFLSYLVKVAAQDAEYRVFGYQAKQVRDQIHSADVIAAFDAFAADPRPGEVYNLGGGRENSVSMREAFAHLEERLGRPVRWTYDEQNRRGDHICYISDLSKFSSHYPQWSITRTLNDIIDEMLEFELQRLGTVGV